jgi:hypothetical protein
MNKHMLGICLSFIAGGLFLVGCGPENLDISAAMMNDTADKEMYPKKSAMHSHNNEDDEMEESAKQAKPQMRDAASVPVEVVQLPPSYARLPSVVEAEAPVITHSGERREAMRDVIIERDIFIAQPHLNKHLIEKNVTINNKYQDHVHYQPSFANEVAIAPTTVVQTEERLPTTVDTAPAVTVPGVIAPIALGPYCAPWLSGGFHRFCGQPYPANYYPVNGPYYR